MGLMAAGSMSGCGERIHSTEFVASDSGSNGGSGSSWPPESPVVRTWKAEIGLVGLGIVSTRSGSSRVNMAMRPARLRVTST